MCDRCSDSVNELALETNWWVDTTGRGRRLESVTMRP